MCNAVMLKKKSGADNIPFNFEQFNCQGNGDGCCKEAVGVLGPADGFLFYF